MLEQIDGNADSAVNRSESAINQSDTEINTSDLARNRSESGMDQSELTMNRSKSLTNRSESASNRSPMAIDRPQSASNRSELFLQSPGSSNSWSDGAFSPNSNITSPVITVITNTPQTNPLNSSILPRSNHSPSAAMSGTPDLFHDTESGYGSPTYSHHQQISPINSSRHQSTPNPNHNTTPNSCHSSSMHQINSSQSTPNYTHRPQSQSYPNQGYILPSQINNSQTTPLSGYHAQNTPTEFLPISSGGFSETAVAGGYGPKWTSAVDWIGGDRKPGTNLLGTSEVAPTRPPPNHFRRGPILPLPTLNAMHLEVI